LVEAEVMEAVEGTILAGAPILPVSAITGQGLDQLRQTLDQVLAKIPARPTEAAHACRGPGFYGGRLGTVVTGTLSDGSLRVGQEVEILPARLKARIRACRLTNTNSKQPFPAAGWPLT